jgi:hypothetical protein
MTRRDKITKPMFGATVPTRYCDVPLLELTRRIAFERDRIALEELQQNRPLFCHKGEGSLLMATFLRRLRESNIARKWTGGDVMTLEKAYDLTIDKFSNWVQEKEGKDPPLYEINGPDCRYYYRAFYDYTIAGLYKMNCTHSQIQTELIAAENLQSMVIRHFYLSCLESKRRAQRFVRCYRWRRDGRAISVWMPSTLSGRQCSLWLEVNIPDYDPTRAGERQRVQEIVNRLLTWPRTISLCDVDGGAENIPAPTDWVSSMVEQEISTHGLARTVAREKAENIQQQRPAIRQLGTEKLKELIHMIFAKLACEDYVEEIIATRFGISKSTFSRFAASRWGGRLDSDAPDLWRNTAQILAAHSAFVMSAKRSGVWKRVAQVLDSGANIERTNNDE